MSIINVAFWNLQNLFDAVPSEIAADLEFTPENGWTEAAVAAKIDALVEGVATMFYGRGPDLLGVCEIETAGLLARFTQALNARLGRDDLTFAHAESPDLRGIDCSLIYSSDIFEPAGVPVGHLVFLRFRTRDIFEVPLRVRETGAGLVVFVSHWPSRSRGTLQSQPYRITVASHLARRVDAWLKLPRARVVAAPLADLTTDMDAAWNRNVLVLGDLNDDPFDISVLSELTATNSLDKLEEDLPAPGDDMGARERYLRRTPALYNMSWKPLGIPGEGTMFFSRDTVRTKQVFDQIITSRGLVYGRSGLRIDPLDYTIHAPRLLWTNQALADDAPRHMVRPKRFDPETGRGYSDHFPVTCQIVTVGMA
ncbi:Endonuclease/exonuclease/phosphatase [Citreicella sp. 357]|nr:Endonuclease/exonuclease/phosphatase [Citreicella sp. 357]